RADGDRSAEAEIAEAVGEALDRERIDLEAPAEPLEEIAVLPRTIPRGPDERHGAEFLAAPAAATEAEADVPLIAPEEPLVFAVAPERDVVDILDAAKPAEPVAEAIPEALDRAARLVMGEGRASISFLQRKLGVPFGDAQRLLAELERVGVVGP